MHLIVKHSFSTKMTSHLGSSFHFPAPVGYCAGPNQLPKREYRYQIIRLRLPVFHFQDWNLPGLLVKNDKMFGYPAPTTATSLETNAPIIHASGTTVSGNFDGLGRHSFHLQKPMARSMKIAVIGQSLFGAEVYRTLRKNGHEIVGVFTIPDDPHGRADPLGKWPFVWS